MPLPYIQTTKKSINLVPIPNQNQKTDQADSHMLHLKDVEGRHA